MNFVGETSKLSWDHICQLEPTKRLPIWLTYPVPHLGFGLGGYGPAQSWECLRASLRPVTLLIE